MRTPIAQARGLGSAREGAARWWAQRATAILLVPLTVWFVGSLLVLVGEDHPAFVNWLRSPVNTVLMVVLVIGLFYHMALGLRVVLEDYVHDDRIKIAAIVVVDIICLTFGVTAIASIIRIVS